MANIGAGLMGGLSGAGTGAAIGSIGGPVGTGIGAGVGGLAGLLGGLLSGDASPEQIRQFEQFTPEQQQALGTILQQALGQLQDPQAGFQPIAAEARRGFQEQTIPSIAERFTGMGAGGQRSSAFAGELGQAGAGLESQLAALGSQFGQRQQELAQQLAGLGLTPQFTQALQQRTPGMFETALPHVLQALGQVGGQYFQSQFNQPQIPGKA